MNETIEKIFIEFLAFNAELPIGPFQAEQEKLLTFLTEALAQNLSITVIDKFLDKAYEHVQAENIGDRISVFQKNSQFFKYIELQKTKLIFMADFVPLIEKHQLESTIDSKEKGPTHKI